MFYHTVKCHYEVPLLLQTLWVPYHIFSQNYTSALSRNQIPHAPQPRLVHCLNSEHSLMLLRHIGVAIKSGNPTVFTYYSLPSSNITPPLSPYQKPSPPSTRSAARARLDGGKAAKVISHRQAAVASSAQSTWIASLLGAEIDLKSNCIQ